MRHQFITDNFLYVQKSIFSEKQNINASLSHLHTMQLCKESEAERRIKWLSKLLYPDERLQKNTFFYFIWNNVHL